jgi:L-fucose mutarotase/ribose pyranase (RbsD/FucU family)
MLIGISPVIGPELLDTLFLMGHGDELVLADSFLPAIRSTAASYARMASAYRPCWTASWRS